MYPEKKIIQEETCTPRFTATLQLLLFTKASTWEKSKCPLTEDVVHIHRGLHLAIERNKTGSFVAMCMDLETVVQRKYFFSYARVQPCGFCFYKTLSLSLPWNTLSVLHESMSPELQVLRPPIKSLLFAAFVLIIAQQHSLGAE